MKKAKHKNREYNNFKEAIREWGKNTDIIKIGNDHFIYSIKKIPSLNLFIFPFYFINQYKRFI